MKKNSTQISLIMLLLMSLFSACFKGSEKKYDLPIVVTNDVVIESASTSAWTGGLITNTTANYIAYGVCYSSANPEPTLSDNKTSEKVDKLSFNSHLKGLTPNTVYYARAYVTNSTGTGYGNVVQFKTGSDQSSAYENVSTFTGSTQGYQNGDASTALFNRPNGLVTDAAGNIYVADSYNSVIRKITPDGVSTTIAGTGTLGYKDGPAATAQFYAPSALAIDGAGNIFVADLGNNIIRKITPNGVVSTFAGNGSVGYGNGTASAATFNGPSGIVFDAQGNLYVADSGNSLIRKVTPTGDVTTIAGNRVVGYVNGTGTSTSFNKPDGIAIDATGNIYVAESANKVIRKISKDYIVTNFIGGLDSLSFAIGKPQAINIDANNNFYITDGNGRIVKISKDKIFTVLAGKTGSTGTTDGDGSTALFNAPKGITSNAQGSIFVADFNNNRIRKVN